MKAKKMQASPGQQEKKKIEKKKAPVAALNSKLAFADKSSLQCP